VRRDAALKTLCILGLQKVEVSQACFPPTGVEPIAALARSYHVGKSTISRLG
jgi:hypothetical protein